MDTPSRCPRQSESQGLEEDLPLGQGLLLQTGQVGGLEGLRDETRLEGAVEVPPRAPPPSGPFAGTGPSCYPSRVLRGKSQERPMVRSPKGEGWGRFRQWCLPEFSQPLPPHKGSPPLPRGPPTLLRRVDEDDFLSLLPLSAH